MFLPQHRRFQVPRRLWPLMTLLLFEVLTATVTTARAEDGPTEARRPVIVPSEKTTLVVQPLDAEGYVDFRAALNAHLGEGVSASDNAAIPLLRSIGPDEHRPELLNQILRDLNQPEWSSADGQWVNITAGQYNAEGEPDGEAARFQRELEMALTQPWKAEDCPLMAALLKKNDTAMAVIAKGMQRPRYYRPLTASQPDEMLMASLLPDVQAQRDIARQFCARALLRTGSDDLAGARDDLLTVLRLSRLVSHGATLIEGLVGMAIEAIGLEALMVHAADARQTAESLAELRKAVRELPPRATLVTCLTWGERLAGLDTVQGLARGRAGTMSELMGVSISDNGENAGVTIRPEDLAQALVSMSVDWNSAMAMLNGMYDDLARIVAMPDRAQRKALFEALDARLVTERQEATSFSGLALSVISGRKSRGKNMGKILAGLLLPAVQGVSKAHDRAEMRSRLVDTGLAVLQYRQAHDSWPAELSDLGEEFLAEPSTDLFNDQPIRYVVQADRVLVYSVGPNGRDDGARPTNYETGDDDIVVTIPLAPAK